MLRFEQKARPDAEKVKRMAARLDLSERMAEALLSRGADTEQKMRAFCAPCEQPLSDPFQIADMQKAVDRVRVAAESGERICIYGDYDVDGVCGTAMLYRFLKSHNANVGWYIPSRHNDGYGVNADAVRRLSDESVKLLITVDNGVSAQKELALCYELNMQAVIMDHHVLPSELPRCEAMLLPTPDEQGVCCCGAGVVLKFIHAMAGEAVAREYIPFAGWATVADVVPMLGENRTLVALTLERMQNNDCCVGMRALMETAIKHPKYYNAHDIAFVLAPRMNAASRMAEASICMELMCTEDMNEALAISARLNELNEQRRKEEAWILEQAEAQLAEIKLCNSRFIVLHGKSWNPGILGIVASRLTERYNRPALLFGGEGEVKGSGRSVPGVDIHAALNEYKELYISFGGHAGAVGATIEERLLPKLKAGLEKHMRERYPDDALIPRRYFEFEVPLDEVCEDMVDELNQLAPFGEDNPMPLTCTRNVLLEGITQVGKPEKVHIKANATADDISLPCIAFYWGDQSKNVSLRQPVDLLYRPDMNDYMGESTLQLRLEAYAPRAIGDVEEYIAGQRTKFIDAICDNILYNSMRGFGDISFADPDEKLKELFDADVMGTLILCFTEQGARDAINAVKRFGLFDRVDICVQTPMERVCGYNTLLIAPLMDSTPFDRFNNVLLYDGAASTGAVCEMLKRCGDAAVTLGTREYRNDVRAYRRGDYGKAYMALKQRPYLRHIGLDGLCAFIFDACGDRLLARTAAKVFIELNFVGSDGSGGYRLNTLAPERKLEESAVYRVAAQLPAMREEYITVVLKQEGDKHGA